VGPSIIIVDHRTFGAFETLDWKWQMGSILPRAYVTKTQYANTGTGVTHSIHGAHDFNTGLLTSFTDQNLQPSYIYDVSRSHDQLHGHCSGANSAGVYVDRKTALCTPSA
jgi:hypothetical protein